MRINFIKSFNEMHRSNIQMHIKSELNYSYSLVIHFQWGNWRLQATQRRFDNGDGDKKYDFDHNADADNGNNHMLMLMQLLSVILMVILLKGILITIITITTMVISIIATEDSLQPIPMASRVLFFSSLLCCVCFFVIPFFSFSVLLCHTGFLSFFLRFFRSPS